MLLGVSLMSSDLPTTERLIGFHTDQIKWSSIFGPNLAKNYSLSFIDYVSYPSGRLGIPLTNRKGNAREELRHVIRGT